MLYYQGCRGDGISIPIPTPYPYPEIHMGITIPTADLPYKRDACQSYVKVVAAKNSSRTCSKKMTVYDHKAARLVGNRCTLFRLPYILDASIVHANRRRALKLIHTATPDTTHRLSSLMWRCELSRLDRQAGAFCVWSVSECVGRRSATAGRTPPDTTRTGPSCLVWWAVWII